LLCRVLPPRLLRLITSLACREEKRVLLAVVAAMCGVNRLALYRMLWSGRVSADMAELLTPIVRAFEADKLKFRRTGPRSRYPNRWEVVET
jgi:hypothetical protein